MKKHFYINLILLAIMLLSVPGTVLAQASYDDFCKPTVTKNGNNLNKRWQVKGEILNDNKLSPESPKLFSPTGNNQEQDWANTTDEILAYPGATFDLKVYFGNNGSGDTGWGSLTVFQLRSDKGSEFGTDDKIFGLYDGSWKTGTSNVKDLFNNINNDSGKEVSASPDEFTATFPIQIPGDIQTGEMVVVRFIICKYVTDVPSEYADYDGTPCATDAVQLNYCDYIVRIVEDMAARTVTVSSAGNGTAEITNPQGADNGSINTNLPVTVRATPATGYKFKNWTNADNGQEISTSNPFTYTGKEAASLIANFEKEYPEMKHFFFNDGLNKYLRGADYTLDGSSYTRIHYANTAAEIPFTDYNGTLVNSSASRATMIEQATAEGAQLDWTDNKIVIPEGRTSFTMKFYGWTENIYSARHQKNIAAALNWTEQAIYIDWNNDGNFSGSNELYAPLHSAAGNNNFGGNIATGWTREFNIPDGQPSGTYRMRVVHAEPNGAWGSSKTWNTILFTDLQGVIQNGYAYDFDIVIEEPVATNPTITWATPANGSFTVTTGNGTEITSGQEVTAGTEVTITPTADRGYELESVKVNGKVLTANKGKYKTTITENTTIIVTFKVLEYQITWFANQAGLFTVTYNEGGATVSQGDYVPINTVLKVTPVEKEGYTVSRVYYIYYTTEYDIDKDADGNYIFTVTQGDQDYVKLIYINVVFSEATVPLGVNKTWSSTLPGYVNGHKNGFAPEMNCARIEVDDNLIKVDGTRSNNISMAAWVKIIETNQDVSQAQSEKNYYGSSGVILMGHRQPQVFGYGGAPSFSLSFKGESKLAIFSRAKVDDGYPDNKAQTSETFDIEYGKWVHIAFTAALTEESTSEVTTYKPVYTAYINGKKVCEMTMTEHTDPQLPFLPDTHNGQETVFVFGEGINAQFDNIMIWNKNISESEVKESMKGYANPSLVDGLVGYYTLDELNEDGTSPNILGGSENIKYSKIEIENYINDINIHLGRTWGPNDAANASKVFLSKSDVESKVADITAERSEPQGGARFFRSGTEIQTSEWELNGNEDFGYITNLAELTRLDYNGVDKVALADDVLAVYHNGEPGLPVYVKGTDLESMTAAKTDLNSSYVVAGLDYTVQMPGVAKQWMPISMPAEVDLVANAEGSGVRPGLNFWYAEPVVNGENVTWTDITDNGNTDGTSYLNNLNPGIISVPESRINQNFVFFTAMNTPVVMRAYNQNYAAAQMPQAGVLKFVANPYPTEVTAAQLTGNATNMTVYRMNAVSGNFDPVEGSVTLNEFEPVFVFNNAGNPSMAPRYIGTKDVSGVLEAEAVYNVNVRGAEGAVEVEAFVPADVEIFTVNGVKVAAENIEGTRAFNLQPGIYVVRTVADGNAGTVKVVVE